MGHAGAWVGLGEGTAESKYKALESVGVTMVDHPAKFGGVMKDILAKTGRNMKDVSILNSLPHALGANTIQGQSATQGQQRRSYHTYRRPHMSSTTQTIQQRRSLHLSADHSTDLLKSYNISSSPFIPENADSTHFLGITVSRSARSPCIIASPTSNPSQLHHRVQRFPFDYRQGPTPETIQSALAHLQLDAAPPKGKAQTAELISNLWTLFREKEAIQTSVSLAIPPSSDTLQIFNPYLFFDDAAYKSNKRHADLHALRDTSMIPPTELEAEKSGIVFVRLDKPSTTSTSPSSSSAPAQQEAQPTNLVGTLVNGAGLAMNTNDVVNARLATLSPTTTPTYCANFLDTGGKATSQTISTSFKLILSDPRVSVVFVNIFGGLTLCDMIAEGIILAFKEVGVNKPVVVRLRGTNEEPGQKILEEASLPIRAFDDFEEAVREVGRLANGGA
jgi:succinyl-CoA synthetase alpha subunit